MNGYLCKYVGTYRVLAEYDRGTNDWVRDEFGKIDESFDDFYIPLKNNYGKILLYDELPKEKDAILALHITSGKKAQEIMRQVAEQNRAKDLISSGLALKIMEGDGDVLIYIKESLLPYFTPFIKPSTYGAKIKPFDSKNLPQPNKIPRGELKKLEELKVAVSPKGNYKWANLTRDFIKSNFKINLKDFRKTGMNYCNYIYQNGLWEKYLVFLNKNIK